MKRSRFTEEQIINQSFCIEVTRYHTYHKWHYPLSHLPIHRQIAGNRQTPELAKENGPTVAYCTGRDTFCTDNCKHPFDVLGVETGQRNAAYFWGDMKAHHLLVTSKCLGPYPCDFSGRARSLTVFPGGLLKYAIGHTG